MNGEKISVIIPVYNVEKYLRQCLNSVVGQTYKNLEIIVVDDGSPDNCGAICDEYAMRDGRIKVIHKQNGGLSEAWNTGLDAASGSWISFVDSDDWLDLDYFEKMSSHLALENPEVLQAGGYIEESKDGARVRPILERPFLFEKGEGRRYLMRRTLCNDYNDPVERNLAPVVHVWDKLYSAKFLKEKSIFFDPHIRAGLANDGLFNIEVFDKAKTVKGCMYQGYHYRYTTTSGTFRYDPERPQSAHYVLEQIESYIENHGQMSDLKEALNCKVIRYIKANMERSFFNPNNSENGRVISSKINDMKKQKCYYSAINSKSNRYLSRRQIVLKYTLRLPWIWPLKLLYTTDQKIKG